MKRLIRPIEHLSKVALQVQKGDLEVRSGIQREDEIGILAGEFDTMVEELARHHKNLEQLVDERTQDLTDANLKLSGEIAERKQARRRSWRARRGSGCSSRKHPWAASGERRIGVHQCQLH